MKETAQILRFKGRLLCTAADIIKAQVALMADIATGDITLSEGRKIQGELNQRIGEFESALKTVSQLKSLEKFSVKED